jgi:hypothetical protein
MSSEGVLRHLLERKEVVIESMMSGSLSSVVDLTCLPRKDEGSSTVAR